MRFSDAVGERFQCVIQLFHLRSVMLVVVKVQGSCVDARFQRRVIVGQGWQQMIRCV